MAEPLPWYIVLGYLTAFVLLWIAGRTEGGGTVTSAISNIACGLVFLGTTLTWFTVSMEVRAPLAVWIALPVVFVAFVLWQSWRQRDSLRRLGVTNEVTFGVLPKRGRTVPFDQRDSLSLRRVLELEHQGHRLLGVEYPLTEPDSATSRVTDRVGGIYSMIELRIPASPTLLITPKVGAFEPDYTTPFEDARITRIQVGTPKPSLKPSVQPREVLAGEPHKVAVDPEFDRRFEVTTEDPEFAAKVLTPEVRELILSDLWFRVHEVVFDQDALWTAEADGLNEDRLLGNARHLAIFAAAVTPNLWPGTEFARVTARAETGYDLWFDESRGFVRNRVNRYREAMDRQPLSPTTVLTRSLLAAAMVMLGLLPIANGIAAAAGLASEVQLTVLDSTAGDAGRSCGPNRTQICDSQSPAVRGTYEDSGQTHEVVTTWRVGQLPERGDVVPVRIGPIWWNTVFQNSDAVASTILVALLPVALGLLFFKMIFRPKAPRRVRILRQLQESRQAESRP
ncbi:hypothetical protein [Amycolatopsis echigonensis]|uniref:Uncharacterized protein n=1 Tax=Amycolatopsis echigonensis TaxID=2576905 RepID=A0A2N3WE28_9PSEU|nr:MULTISPECIES: hypothetical protein [Amycolatopsis]MBB2499714.1 hypothetical protein [Amycolatopsis echigonensis]PKV92128.1 hypothetical protein ATK30_2918 [Amycolatopsis niigatensis]